MIGRKFFISLQAYLCCVNFLWSAASELAYVTGDSDVASESQFDACSIEDLPRYFNLMLFDDSRSTNDILLVAERLLVLGLKSQVFKGVVHLYSQRVMRPEDAAAVVTILFQLCAYENIHMFVSKFSRLSSVKEMLDFADVLQEKLTSHSNSMTQSQELVKILNRLLCYYKWVLQTSNTAEYIDLATHGVSRVNELIDALEQAEFQSFRINLWFESLREDMPDALRGIGEGIFLH